MTLKTDFQKLASTLINGVFGSIAQPVTIRHPLYTNYEESTGAMITAHEDHIVNGILGTWIDNNQAAAVGPKIMTNDVSLLISKSDLPITPITNYDTAIDKDGTEWVIVFVQKDEAEATLTIRLSKNLEE